MITLALHGGAGARRGLDYKLVLDDMHQLILQARDSLLAGDSALDVVVATVRMMERSGNYVAGRGASPNAAGAYELDAAVMDGATTRAGAVAALEGFVNPVDIARAVMERTPHVLVAGSGAARFAHEQSFEPVIDSQTWFVPAATSESNHTPTLGHGTVGCVACDGNGRLAAATSTGGVFGKLPGRVGDTPLIGAGCWADRQIAVLATGQGEYFIRSAAAAQIAFRVQYGGWSLDSAADAVLEEIGSHGGEGGLIAISCQGEIVTSFNAEGMKWGAMRQDGSIAVGVFERFKDMSSNGLPILRS